MKSRNTKKNPGNHSSRRTFLRTLGATGVGLVLAPYLKSGNIFAYGHGSASSYLAQVAITQATSYDRALIRQKVQHLFSSLGGISDVVKSGNKVGIKINLTGGGGIPDNMWTHPEVLRAVGELIIDAGVKAEDITIVEALWSDASFNNNGYADVQKYLGAKMVNLNNPDPYTAFVDMQVGDMKFQYSSFRVNAILTAIDVYISIPKMKQHYEAGVTCSLKNQIGIVPKQLYTISSDQGRRAALHNETGGSSVNHLPRSICDLNLARPVHLAVIDGVKNARGGEGTWNPTFRAVEDHVLLAGKNPVSTDSVAAYFMGNDPEAATLQLPGGGTCDNYLELLHQKGVGTNQMREIEIVGDGAGLITAVLPKYESHFPNGFQLCQNFPNPFNPSTIINFYLPTSSFVTLKLFSITGQEIETLVEGEMPPGQHAVHWSANGCANGVYLYRLQAGEFVDAKKMIYQK